MIVIMERNIIDYNYATYCRGISNLRVRTGTAPPDHSVMRGTKRLLLADIERTYYIRCA